jgi:hypothetical protein
MQAQVWPGAMVMVIIGSSVARAFGMAGAAGIVRFRTPVEDPRIPPCCFSWWAEWRGRVAGSGRLSTIFLCAVRSYWTISATPKRNMTLSWWRRASPPRTWNASWARMSVLRGAELVQDDEAEAKYNVNYPVPALAQSATDGGRQGRPKWSPGGAQEAERLTPWLSALSP